MQFKDYEYTPINMDDLRKELTSLIANLTGADDYTKFKKVFEEYQTVMSRVTSMASLCNIRHTINTKDEFYANEQDKWDEQSPLIDSLVTEFYKAIIANPLVEELKKEVPETFFLQIEYSLKVFDEKIVSDLQEENKLAASYQKLIASAEIEFQGETYTLSSIGAKMEDKDEDVRKEAYLAYWGWMENQEAEIDTIYDKLVKLRDAIAKKLGFENYIELGYYRMNRFDYNKDDVENYRQQVLNDVVPVASRLYQRQQERLGKERLDVYNYTMEFLSGNPTPQHSKDEMVQHAQKMYRELSKETGEFFDFMVEHDLLDLDSKPGKAAGGYCTYIPTYRSPFIYANFNKTSHDADVLTHEAGHAFQVFSSRDIKPNECIWPTMETAEIHSMSMEFFAWPWMEGFFEQDTEKYYYTHLGSAVKFVPYGVLVDHFQHEVYANPNMTPKERKDMWRSLEKQYLPEKDYSEVQMLEKGTWWFRQPHIFLNPFYYIDYTLAQVCALQFWLRIYEKDDKAFDDYYHICKLGGTKTFTQVVEEANLKVPFKDGCLKDTMKAISEYLETIDDKKLNVA